MKCFLHIGLHKTGTTAIQKFSFENKEYLLEKGYDYAGDFLEHSRLLVPLYINRNVDSRKTKGNFFSKKMGNHEVEYANNVFQKMINEISSEKIILSGEGFSLLEPDEVKLLKDDFDKYFDEVKVIVYVREPVSWLTSYFLQKIKHGIPLKKITADVLDDFSIRDRIEAFVDLFGNENVIFKRFDNKILHENDIVIDFYDTIGIDVRDKRFRIINNKKISLEALHVIDSIASTAFKDDDVNIELASLNTYLKIVDLFKQIGSTKKYFDFLTPDFVYSYFKEDLQWLADKSNIVFDPPEKVEPEHLDSIKLNAVENLSVLLSDYVMTLQIKDTVFFDKLKEFSKILNDNKELPQYFFATTSNWAIKFKFYQKALELLEESLTLYSGTAEIFNNLAFIYDQFGRIDEAEEAVKRAIGLKDTDSGYYVLLGRLLKKKNEIKGAREAFEKAAEIDSLSAVAHIQLSMIYEKEGRLDSALEAVNKAIGINDANAFFYFQQGCLLKKKNKFKESRTALEKSISIDPSLAGPHFQLSLVCEKLGDITAAIEEAEAGLAVKPDNDFFKKRLENYKC
jgi:tetratricopeptide (TPR) repeat protein